METMEILEEDNNNSTTTVSITGDMAVDMEGVTTLDSSGRQGINVAKHLT